MKIQHDSYFGNKFAQHYQPIVDMNTLNLVRYEALLRPVGFSRNTEALVRHMERNGQIQELDLWSISKAIESASVVQGAPPIAVNLSAKSLCDPLFQSEAEWILSNKPEGVKVGFEITESEPIGDMVIAKSTVDMLKGMGCSVGLDDFGTGHATLDVARDLQLGYVKFSSRLTTAITLNPAARTLISKTVDICNSLGMHVVAEHIDNARQYSWLRDAGCDMGQGWLFAKAAREIENRKNYAKTLKAAVMEEVMSPKKELESPKVRRVASQGLQFG